MMAAKEDLATATRARRAADSDVQEAAPVAPPCVMVIFGAAGDLTKRLVVPALYNLVNDKRLSENFQIVGVDLAAKTAEEWRQSLTDMMNEFVTKGGGEFEADHIDQDAWKWLTSRMTYLQGDLTDPGCYRRVGERLAELDKAKGTAGNHLFYLAVADRFFGIVVDQLGAAGLVKEEESGGWRRVVIEKPFGHDLTSARALNTQVLKVLTERQVYRMDHFLGKETVQNIMVLRFANGLFEPLWNRNHIDHVQITASETVGVEHRGKFYEKTGALRDMVPNHVFQLLSMTAMEPPNSFDADAVRAKKAEVLQAVHLLDPESALRDAVRGQYGAGTVLGKPVNAYRQEPDVAPDSNTETYVAAKLMIDNWRWAGVPFYLRTGKYLAQRMTQIAIRFRQAPFALFRDTTVASLTPNWMILRIQPEEGISLRFAAKHPGPSVKIATGIMDFAYKDFFRTEPSTGYETLLYDCMIGDATLFQRADNVEAGWQVVQPILDAWASKPPGDFPNYKAGTDGPAPADELLARDGRAWLPLTG
jgi:glucose-6-phosphate 1-dehydrogenase